MCWRGIEQGVAADEPARFRLFTGATVITFYLSLSYYNPEYDTICYFNVQSKADMSQLNLPHEPTTKTWKTAHRMQNGLAVWFWLTQIAPEKGD